MNGNTVSGTQDYFRWHPSWTYLAHLFKGVVQQHHKEDIPALRRILPADGIVFDVGAHAGQYSKLFASLVPNGHVFAFEPATYARSILRIALWTNRCRNVTPFPVGLGSQAAMGFLTLPIKRRGSYGYGLTHFGSGIDRESAAVRDLAMTVRLDDIADLLSIPRLDLIKADIEGWELRMLEGATQTIERFRPYMMLELEDRFLSRAGDSLDAALRFLDRTRYRPAVWQHGRFVAADAAGAMWWLPEERAQQLLHDHSP